MGQRLHEARSLGVIEPPLLVVRHRPLEARLDRRDGRGIRIADDLPPLGFGLPRLLGQYRLGHAGTSHHGLVALLPPTLHVALRAFHPSIRFPQHLALDRLVCADALVHSRHANQLATLPVRRETPDFPHVAFVGRHQDFPALPSSQGGIVAAVADRRRPHLEPHAVLTDLVRAANATQHRERLGVRLLQGIGPPVPDGQRRLQFHPVASMRPDVVVPVDPLLKLLNHFANVRDRGPVFHDLFQILGLLLGARSTERCELAGEPIGDGLEDALHDFGAGVERLGE